MIEDKLLELARRFDREARERYSDDLAERRNLMYEAAPRVGELRAERDEARKQLKALEAELVRLRAAVSDWLKQECAPDCAACCVLDASFVGGKNEPA